MRQIFAPSFSSKLRNLTAELRMLDRDFKSNPPLESESLREFRQALDNVRLTAWTAHELLTLRESTKNPQAVISFLTAERLRRFSQMARDLSGDLEQRSISWPAQAVRDLGDALAFLGAQLTMVGESKEAGKGAS